MRMIVCIKRKKNWIGKNIKELIALKFLSYT